MVSNNQKVYEGLVVEIQEYLDCRKAFARQIVHTTLGERLLNPDFRNTFFSDCMNNEAGLVVESAFKSAQELNDESARD